MSKELLKKSPRQTLLVLLVSDNSFCFFYLNYLLLLELGETRQLNNLNKKNQTILG
jgi:hypothetical protein